MKALSSQLLIVLLVFGLSACSQQKREVEDVAQAFVDSYYQQDKLAQALPYTTGAARVRVSQELNADKQLGVSESASEKPKVVASLLRTILTHSDKAELIWKLDSSYQQKLSLKLKMLKLDGHWLVASIEESASSLQ